MSADTSMSDRQKLKALNRLSGLNRTAEELIHNDARSPGDMQVLLEAMQAFKDGKLGAIIRSSKSEPVRDITAVLELEVRGVPFSPGDQRYVADRGVRYVGELYYVFFDPRGRNNLEIRGRLTEVLADRFGLQPHLDPIGLGWRPSYWDDPAFTAELNTLILERCPTPEAPDWEREIPSYGFVRQADYTDRGVARRLHCGNRHYIGEILRRERTQHCPVGMVSTGTLLEIKQDLKEVGSRLWSGALLPRDWSPPDWQGELWQAELAAIAKDEEAFREAMERRTARRRAEEQRRTEESTARQAEREAELKKLPLNEVLDRRLDDLKGESELAFRTKECMRNAGIETIGQLIVKTETELLRCKNFGRKCLADVKHALATFGLRLDMTAADFNVDK